MIKIKHNIGLEIHCRLLTETKLFSSCGNSECSPENTLIDRYTLGYPGTLPLLNKSAILMAVKFAIALNCKINNKSIFHRKHYFYHDLPKGFQITQYDTPLGENGFLKLPNGKIINIERIHLEEDAGKSIFGDESLCVDYNRAGMPLLEIVSSPYIQTADDAALFAKEIKNIAVCLGINNGNLQNGDIRCDANVSVRYEGQELGDKIEIKNLNSFKFIKDSINYEIHRLKKLTDDGIKIKSETRTYDEKNKKTYLIRTKDSENDYRFIVEPDIPPLVISDESISEITVKMPEIPQNKRQRYSETINSKDEIELLIEDFKLAEYYDKLTKAGITDFRTLNSVFFNELRKYYSDNKQLPEPEIFINILNKISGEIIPKKKTGFLISKIFEENLSVEELIDKYNLSLINNAKEIVELIDVIINKHSNQILDLYERKKNPEGYIIGKIIKITDGRANPKIVGRLVLEKIQNLTGE